MTTTTRAATTSHGRGDEPQEPPPDGGGGLGLPLPGRPAVAEAPPRPRRRPVARDLPRAPAGPSAAAPPAAPHARAALTSPSRVIRLTGFWRVPRSFRSDVIGPVSAETQNLERIRSAFDLIRRPIIPRRYAWRAGRPTRPSIRPRERRRGPAENLAYVVDAQHRHERRPRARRARRARPRAAARRPTARSSAGSRCRTSATSCTTSAGTPAARRCARGRRTRTSSAATCSCPGLRSSRIHVVDIKADPRAARSSSRTIEAEEIAAQDRLQPPAHRPLRPRRHLRQRARRPRRRRPGRHLPARPRRLRRSRARGRTTAARRSCAYDFWWHLGYDTRDHQRVGHAEHGRGRRSAASCCSATSTATSCTSGTCASARHRPGDRPRRRAPDGARAAAGARPEQGVRLRRRRRRRPPTCRASVWLWHRATTARVRREKVITIPAEPAEADQLPAAPQAVRRRAAAGHRHRPVGRRPLAVRLLLGHRRAQALRRHRPVQPARDRLGAPRRHRRPRAAPGRGPAQRRPADGRGQPRRPARLPDQLALRRVGRAVLPGRASTAGWSSSTPATTAR